MINKRWKLCLEIAINGLLKEEVNSNSFYSTYYSIPSPPINNLLIIYLQSRKEANIWNSNLISQSTASLNLHFVIIAIRTLDKVVI